ncbi:MAG: hypothetical protein H6824_03350 [Planctomycetaceae bacterium]|nr:hypothetical protein [Planctomycetaceae bacterium]
MAILGRNKQSRPGEEFAESNRNGKRQGLGTFPQLEKAATTFELLLIGPCSGEVVKAGKIEGVDVPMPKSLDVEGLFQQAAHGIDVYLESRNVRSLPVAVRELLVEGLVGKLMTYSTKGEKIARQDLDNLLITWVLSTLPDAVETILYSRCEVLCDTVVLASTSGIKHQLEGSITILLPIHFLNAGERPSVIENLGLRVHTPERTLIYEAIGVVDYAKVLENKVIDNKFIQSTSNWIVVLKNEVKDVAVAFFPVDHQDYPFGQWKSGACTLELYVQYRGDDYATCGASLSSDFGENDLSAPSEGGTIIHQVGRIVNLPTK